MSEPFNLLAEPWILVRLASGARVWRTIPSILADRGDDPPVAPAWDRADLDGVTVERLIGCLALAFSVDHDGWIDLWHERPGETSIAAALDRHRDAFVLDGDGPRFMQDPRPLEHKVWPAAMLAIDGLSENGEEKNTDLIVKRPDKRGGTKVLSRAAAAIILDAVQTWAPGRGPGYHTSIRGGGPMTTLVVPPQIEERPSSLADLVFWNLPNRAPTIQDPMFPWVALVGREEENGKRDTKPADVDSLHVFHGMPQRYRLLFSENAERQPCDVTGIVDDIVVTGFRKAPNGTDYQGPWEHPLTPYARSTKKKEEVWIPVHPRPNGLTWTDWLGAVAGERNDDRRPARIIREARARVLDLGLDDKPLRVRCHGFDMNKGAARGFVEQEVPFYVDRDERIAEARTKLARRLVLAGEQVSRELEWAVKVAFFNERQAKKAKGEFSIWPERLIAQTEAAFFDAVKNPVDPETPLRFRDVLRRATMTLFDEAVDLDAIDDLDRAKDVVLARKGLTMMFAGLGKPGAELFAALGLAVPAKPSSSSQTIGKRKERAR